MLTNVTGGPARERLDLKELATLREAGAVALDDRRRRPLYFDGRFLRAADLTRDQAYFLSRQSDLGLAAGAGIVHGLDVSSAEGSASAILISPGHGITPAGESVIVPAQLRVELANIPQIQRLDAAFGLLEIPREPARNRAGLYVLALRPVEFSANPIASYPTTVTGTRSVHDGEIIEATVITLVPYPDDGTAGELALRRARVAHDIFVHGGNRGLPAGALPLAMLALDRGIIQWLDPFLVRREVGAEHEQILGLGFAPRARREAHLRQYDQHLGDVRRQRAAGNRGDRFPAAEHFLALPPAGRMPTAAISTDDFTQIFFPPEVEAELSIVPADEIPVIVEESLLLPPIDLTLRGDEQESTGVLVLVPVRREEMRSLTTRLTTIRTALKPAAPGLLAKRAPIEVLRGLRAPGLRLPLISDKGVELDAPTVSVAEAEWRALLKTTDLLWYVRRRNALTRADVMGAPVRLTGDDFVDEDKLVERLKTLGLQPRYQKLIARGSMVADAEVVALLQSSTLQRSRLLTDAAMREFEANERFDHAAALAVLTRFSDPKLGEGIARLELANEDIATNEKVIKNLASSGKVPEFDRIGRLMEEEKLSEFANAVAEAAGSSNQERLVALAEKGAQNPDVIR